MLRENNFQLNSKTTKIMMKSEKLGNAWKHQCERSLHLAKMLGNTYTASLYNGLLSLVCDQTIDLSGKKIMLFSYGSGCAASLFVVHVKSDYRRPGGLQSLAQYKERLDSRLALSPDLYA